MLIHPVLCELGGHIEDWLKKLESQMKSTIRSKCRKCSEELVDI
jgi:hypothetical protein